jgi:undecaprenyl-diphosphatase
VEEIIQFDKDVFLFLHNLGSERWDGFWLIITKQLCWTPIFLIVFYFLLKKVGIKLNFWKYYLSALFLPIGLILFIIILKANFRDKELQIKLKNILLIFVFLSLLILVTDQLTNFFKYSFERLRPCNDPTLEGLIRTKEDWVRKSFGYFSGHASNSMATTTFIFLLFRKDFKYAFLLFLFPLIFAYSRIYLGLHFPGDILTGYLFGLFLGTFFYRVYKIMQPKYFPVS